MDALVQELDVDAIAEQLDLDALMARLDLDQLVHQLDVNAIAEQLDLDALMARLDLDQLVHRLDVNAIAEQLDLDALMARLDLDQLVHRLDVNAIAEQLDLDALMTRLDLDQLVHRLDVNAIAEQLDLDALMTRINMAELTAGATQDVALSGLDLVRRQLVRMDATVDSTVDKILRRQRAERPDAPTAIAAMPEEAVPLGGESLERRKVSGNYAGPVSRLLALAGDLLGSITSFGVFGAITVYFLGILTGWDVDLDSGGVLPVVLFVAWMLLWFWVPVALFGRTLAMAIVGIAVVRRDGSIAHSGRAFIRAITTPISLALALIGLIGIVAGRERRALHDVFAGTVVVYDWGAREAEQPVSIREQLSARVNRRRIAEPV